MSIRGFACARDPLRKPASLISSANIESALQKALEDRDRQGLLRSRVALRQIDATHVELDGRRCVNFASNDYLGLTHHPRMIEAVQQAIGQHGTGSGASALVTGHTDLHADAETRIASWKNAQSSVLLSSGYQASFAAVQTLAALGAQAHAGGVRFLLDKLCHASLIDAVIASQQPYRVFPHNQLEKLERLLAESNASQLQVVITESVFSMDGDACDLRRLAELKQKHSFVLLLDEAHASGVYGREGAGYADEAGLYEVADVTIVTLSKALGASGAAICGSSSFCEAVANFGRAAIYSTNVPPATAMAAITALNILREEPHRPRRVRQLAQRVRDELMVRSLTVPGLADSPIIPVVLGDERQALAVAGGLKEAGLLVAAIRPPTVAKGTSRLRVTLSCEHSDEEVQRLVQELLRAVGQ